MIRRFREPANGLTHLAGAALALLTLAVLLILAIRSGSPRAIVAFAISA